MLSPNELEFIPDKIVKLYRNLQLTIMQDIVERVAINKDITRTADWEISRAYDLGVAKQVIKRHIQTTLGLTSNEIDNIYTNILAVDYARYEPIYKKQGKSFIPYQKNKPLQQLISGVKKQTKGEFKNITQSLGFAVKNPDGTRTFKPIAKYYQKTLDDASMQMLSGVYDYNTIIKRTVKEMTDSGLRFIDYETGHSNRVEVAARRAIMTGFNQTVGRITEENAEKLDAELFEVSYHVGARPDHQEWQGKVYTMDELITICGYGEVDGLKGANCRHDFNPFWEGISERTYTDEELEEMTAEENTPKEYGDREYTTYEATQRQRQLETRIRAKRAEISLLEKGGANEDDILAAKARYHALSNEYSKFSKAMNLPQQRERINVDSLLNIGKYPKDKILKNAVGNDIILVNKTKLTFAPNTITQVVNKRGGITRNYYGKTGVQIKQISNNDHGHIKESKLGKHGEHAHDYHFDNDKKRTVHEKARELTSEERKENADII